LHEAELDCLDQPEYTRFTALGCNKAKIFLTHRTAPNQCGRWR
jgi:hypothetical protein